VAAPAEGRVPAIHVFACRFADAWMRGKLAQDAAEIGVVNTIEIGNSMATAADCPRA
jgi:hypothetical protein